MLSIVANTKWSESASQIPLDSVEYWPHMSYLNIYFVIIVIFVKKYNDYDLISLRSDECLQNAQENNSNNCNL